MGNENTNIKDVLKTAFILFIVFIILTIISIAILFKVVIHKDPDSNNVIVTDTIYNKVTLDSIEYNIIKRDSIIYNITNKYENEIKQANNISDSCAVELFKELVQE